MANIQNNPEYKYQRIPIKISIINEINNIIKNNGKKYYAQINDLLEVQLSLSVEKHGEQY